MFGPKALEQLTQAGRRGAHACSVLRLGVGDALLESREFYGIHGGLLGEFLLGGIRLGKDNPPTTAARGDLADGLSQDLCASFDLAERLGGLRVEDVDGFLQLTELRFLASAQEPVERGLGKEQRPLGVVPFDVDEDDIVVDRGGEVLVHDAGHRL